MWFDFFHSYMFQAGVIPCTAVLINLFIKVSTKKDIHLKVTKHDWEIGFELSLIALALLINHTVILYDRIVSSRNYSEDLLNNLTISSLISAAIVFGMWFVSVLVRRNGRLENGELNLLGVILPLTYGTAIFLGVITWMRST